ncbi:hypothetical protein, partial [Pseudomonas syringae group genomosp. 7]|uniref:hypothetical protein n=1 Tax=Pseudomonas syringae group genomosp. 7 TaxID=251699 RepID=UPI001F1F2E9E
MILAESSVSGLVRERACKVTEHVSSEIPYSLVHDLARRRSGLVRELPGTGSKTDAYVTSGATEITCLRDVSQTFADKSAPTPSGPKPNLPDDVGIGRRFAC